MNGTEIKLGRSPRPRGPVLDDATFDNLRRRITTTSGIYVPSDENSRFVLERRLAPRLRVRGVTSFSDYERILDEHELEAMLDVVAVHETYFFREKRQLKAFSTSILEELRKLDRPIKIWSAGCSTGEEAYTIAMILGEHGLLEDDRVRVIASDLSYRVIESAVKGVYGVSSFRTTEESFKEKYFSEVRPGQWSVNERLRETVQFEQFNLMALTDSRKQALPGDGGFDVIFCRNVLMYFDDDASRETVRSFHSVLGEGGYLLLGHAESLLPLGAGFEPVQIGRELVHRK